MPTTRTRAYFYAKSSLSETDFDDLVYSLLCDEDASAFGRSLLAAANAAAARALIVPAEVPTGTVLPFAGVAAGLPSGYLFCNGASLLRADYADLFAVIGTTYGAADGTHFTLPDLTTRFLKGASADGDVGDTGGAVGHSHTDNTGGTTTGVTVSVPAAAAGKTDGATAVGATGAATVTDPGHAHGIALANADSQPPYIRMWHIIKT